jgi:sterol desaturase/sphingolipid hydroxylase (fatty acid hydroxylase superfamily)
MQKLLALLAASLGGWLGWWLGAQVGMMTGFFLSVIGMGLGLYAARRIAHRYLG